MTETAAGQALAQARNEINKARVAAAGGDTRRQGEYARAAIDYATTSLVDPAATQREVVAAHYFLSEALALDARGNTCGVELIDIEREASGLADEDQLWLRKVLRTAGKQHQRCTAPPRNGVRRWALRAPGSLPALGARSLARALTSRSSMSTCGLAAGQAARDLKLD